MQSLTSVLARRRRASTFGLKVWRTSDIKIPKSLVINGKKVEVNLPDTRGTWVNISEILCSDDYQLEQVRGPIKTIVDIGANAGLFAIAARQAFPDAIIHSYEPNPELAPYIGAQAKALGSTYYPEAVDVKDGRVNLYFLDGKPDTTLGRTETADDGSIPAVALSKVIDRIGGSVDLLKMDCEGAEWGLWEDKDSWQKVKRLTCEYHTWDGKSDKNRDWTEENALKIVQGLGFTIRHKTVIGTYAGTIYATRE